MPDHQKAIVFFASPIFFGPVELQWPVGILRTGKARFIGSTNVDVLNEAHASVVGIHDGHANGSCPQSNIGALCYIGQPLSSNQPLSFTKAQ